MGGLVDHLLCTGLQTPKSLFHHLQSLLCSPCMSSRLSQHSLQIQRLMKSPGCTHPEGCRQSVQYSLAPHPLTSTTSLLALHLVCCARWRTPSALGSS